VYAVHQRIATRQEHAMFSSRTTARIAGALYFVTHVTSVAALLLYGAAAYDSQAPLAGRSSVLTGALLEIVLAVAVVGTGIALLPLLRRYSSGVAAGYLALRTLEASVILTGVVVLLPVVAQPAVTAAPALAPDAILSLRLIHDWTFLVGPGLIVPFHTVLLAWLLWRNGLVPRFIPILGFVGGPVVGAMNLALMFGVSRPIAITAVPAFAWEVSLAAYLIIRGIRQPSDTSPVMQLASETATSATAVVETTTASQRG